jgi:hypothetical protein
MKRFLLSLFVVVGMVLPAVAQTHPTVTTLSSAVSGGANNNIVVVASATGISASTASAQNFILVDKELMEVAAVNSTTLTVRRARAGQASGHASGALVIYGSGGSFNANSNNATGVFLRGQSGMPTGACTRGNNAYLPMAAPDAGPNGKLYDCLNGQWTSGELADLQYPKVGTMTRSCNAPLGGAVYTGIGTSTTVAASSTSTYTSQVHVDRSFYATGESLLKGLTVNASAKKIYALYDAGGNLIANTATAGTATATTASIFQDIAWTAKRIVVGPADYFIVLQGDAGATDTVNMFTTAAGPAIGATVDLGATTFGTIPSTITAPTTFTTAVGPVGCVY